MKAFHFIGGARTPHATWSRGKKGDGSAGGALRDTDVFDLGAIALRGALASAKLEPARLDAMVFGSAYHSHPNNCYGSRYIGLRAGLPDSTPCFAVNMACATSLEAVISAARLIEGGEAELAAAGGSESTSQIRKDVLFPSFNDLAAGEFIGETVEGLARAAGVTREHADDWALRSHERARAAREKGLFEEEIVAVGEVRRDDHILEAPQASYFAEAKPSYAAGIVSGANAHGLVDGGSALIMASEEGLKKSGAAPWGRLAGWGVAGVPPRDMAQATVPAIQAALRKAGWKQDEVDLFEINETFAAQLLIVRRALDLDSEKLNVNGGAVGLGHPFGATGGRLVLTLLKELKRRKAKKGIAAICVGGGQGVALAVEAE